MYTCTYIHVINVVLNCVAGVLPGPPPPPLPPAQAVISEMAGDTSIARLTRVQFHHYIGELTSNLESLEMFDEFADYLMSSMKVRMLKFRP